MSEMKKELKENKMGVMPVPKLLIGMSLPMMISMLVQALYNIVDSMFVAKLSEDALTAVSLAFPIQALMISIASGTGVGINALLSRSLGEKDSFRLQAVLHASDGQSRHRRVWDAVYVHYHCLLLGDLPSDYVRATDAVYGEDNL